MVSIRLACPGEGTVIQRLVRAGGGPAWDWIDWTNAPSYWLIGEIDGEPKGTIMVNPGVPFGRVEFLSLDPSVSAREKAVLCRDLSYAGIATCQRMGSQAVLSNIDTGDGAWRHIAERRGWVVTGEGAYMMKRCV